MTRLCVTNTIGSGEDKESLKTDMTYLGSEDGCGSTHRGVTESCDSDEKG